MRARMVEAAGAELGEAPLWDTRHGRLVWVDITAGLVHLLGGPTYRVGGHVSAALPAAGGGWLLATREGFSTLAEDGTVTPLLTVPGDGMRFNDAKCDPDGRAWAGTMAYDQTPGAATLYRLDPGPIATPVLPGLTISNGLGWSPDGRTMWFVDSLTQRITGYAYADGVLGPISAVVAIEPEYGMPDGLCVDVDGCVWVGLWGGGAVHRYTPGGRLDTVVRVPASQVTSCAFGGSTLYITTATYQMDAAALEREPLAGGLFTVETSTHGPAATPWKGLS
ncbi:SMP-30/gluconolactonase/LRE family protein [Streptosporangium sp. CA-135522]|uniref:SMP-30/gluconolactonase/LRE family protein n=1 Tax=Streptosporangium sp. CA-135522 TaxID=3240072 RepID=UPI003D9144C7